MRRRADEGGRSDAGGAAAGSLLADERGQSIQIGAVLLFAVLILAFSSYQAVVVPDQNRRVEFNHNQQVQRDMVELRNTLLSTQSDGTDGYAEIALGTTYPARIAARNPPSPSGSLATTDPRPVVVRKQGGPDITDEVCPGSDVQTRFVTYEPDYAEFDGAGTIRYEHSLLFHDYRTGGVSMTGQSLVEGDRVQVIPLTGAFRHSGSGTVTVEPKAGLLDISERSDLVVVLPTRLSEAQWEHALAGEVDPADVAVTSGAGGRNLTLTLDGQRTVECGPVGLGSVPPSGARGTGAQGINPAAPGDITLDDEFLQAGSKSDVVLRFNNTASSTNVTRARINFYQSEESSTQQRPTEAEIALTSGPPSGTLVFRDDFTSLNPDVRLDGGTTTDVVLDFSNDKTADPNLDPNSWFVMTLVLETGQQATYFVPIPE